MRGGVTLNELLHTFSYDDREALYKVVEQNLELTEKTGFAWL